MTLPVARPEVEMPFPGYTGRGIRIAVIDSGVNVRHPHIGSVAGGVSIGADLSIVEGEFADVLGHGTAVMAAIQEKAPDAEYWAVQVFHEGLRTTAEALFRAIEWSIENGMDLVNLSLGTRQPEHAARFAALAVRGPALISAVEANGEPTYPGCLDGVLGALVDWECDRHAISSAGGTRFLASGYPRSLPGVPRTRNLHGISFAVANLTGIVARCREATGAKTAEPLAANLARLTSPRPP